MILQDEVMLPCRLGERIIRFAEDHNANAEELRRMMSGRGVSGKSRYMSLSLYNDMIQALESVHGLIFLRQLGEVLASEEYQAWGRDQLNNESHSLMEIMGTLCETSRLFVVDQEAKGWSILGSGRNYLRMRNTQHFHPVLQKGFLKFLAQKGGVVAPRIKAEKNVGEAGETVSVDYLIQWD